METFKFISSSDNAFFKKLKKLTHSHKMRRTEKQVVLEGEHLLESFYGTGKIPNALIFQQDAIPFAFLEKLQQRFQHSVEMVQHFVLPKTLFMQLSQLESLPSCLALVALPQTTPFPSEQESMVILENVQDPGNVGTILRTARAAGIKQIVLSKGCTDVWSPKVLRSGMGAHFDLALYSVDCVVSLITQFRNLYKTYPFFATALNARAKFLYEYHFCASQPVGFIFGNEGTGISSELEAVSSDLLYIPMDHSPTVESLNVASSAAIVLFEYRRQCYYC